MKSNRKIIFLLTLGMMLAALSGAGQNEYSTVDDESRIALRPMLMYSPELDETTKLILRSKLAQVAANNGLAAAGTENRFVITAKVVVLDGDVVESVPPVITYTCEVSFYIVDNEEHRIFSQRSVSLQGAGPTKTKAMAAVLRKIDPKDSGFASFVKKAKEEILKYYNTHCDILIEKATALMAGGRLDEGIEILLDVPPISRECYDEAMRIIRKKGNEAASKPITATMPADVSDDNGSLNWLGN